MLPKYNKEDFSLKKIKAYQTSIINLIQNLFSNFLPKIFGHRESFNFKVNFAHDH